VGCPALVLTEQSYQLFRLYRLIWKHTTPTFTERLQFPLRYLQAFERLEREERAVAQLKGSE
jgi:hypothetical protein